MNASPINAEAISVRGLSKVYGNGPAAFRALDKIDLSIRDGDFVTVVGPSGCGKSTLLQILAGLAQPSEGEVRIDGKVMTGPKPDSIGVVFQEALLLPWKSVVDNVAFPLELKGVPLAERRARALPLLDLVRLSDFADRFPHELSGGMRQRVAIARGLVHEPRILLMDEPFGALDEQTRTRMGDELLRIWDAHRKTVVFITHGLIEAIYLADVVMVMGARPGRFLETIRVDLPRPRTLDMIGSEAFGRLRNRIWDLIADGQP